MFVHDGNSFINTFSSWPATNTDKFLTPKLPQRSWPPSEESTTSPSSPLLSKPPNPGNLSPPHPPLHHLPAPPSRCYMRLVPDIGRILPILKFAEKIFTNKAVNVCKQRVHYVGCPYVLFFFCSALLL